MPPATAPQGTRAAYEHPSFSQAALGTYRLVFSLSEHTIEYALLTDTSEVMRLQVVQNTRDVQVYDFLDQVVFEDELLKKAEGRFKHIEVLTHTKRWMLVPNEFLTGDGLDSYLETQHEVDKDNDQFGRDYLRPIGVNVLYAIRQQFSKRCKVYFKEYSIKHALSALLLESFKAHQLLQTKLSANLTVMQGSFYFTVFNENGLLLCNEFEAATLEDVYFFIFSVLQGLHISPEQLKLIVTGHGKLRPTIEEMLRGYFPLLTEAKALFPAQKSMNQAGLWHDQFSYLLHKTL